MLIKNVLFGIFIAAVIHLLLASSCAEKITNPDGGNDQEAVVIETMKKASDVFLTGDTTQLKSILTNDALKFYSDDFGNIVQVMKKIGEGMKLSKVASLTTNLAEVEITYNGENYMVLLAKQDDESWKIIRF